MHLLIVALVILYSIASFCFSNRPQKTVTRHYDANGKLTGSSESSSSSSPVIVLWY
jgi:hypothetical protein